MKRRTKILLGILLAFAVSIGLLIMYSPYRKHRGYDHPFIYTYIDIDTPPEVVYNYLGNSENARDWSTFVDHIIPLNSDSFPDGTVGSRRRCFREANEQGIWWDELITVVEPHQRRQLTIYNMNNFPVSADDLATEQQYEPLGDGDKCRLTFTLFYLHNDPTVWESFKTKLAAYRVKSVFEGNQANIKRLVEQQYHEQHR